MKYTAQRALRQEEVAIEAPYSGFDQINGQHPWKQAMPMGYIEYEARILRNSKIAYFNFTLAKEMGLLAKDHPERMNPELEKKIIDTFALRIINEYDIINGIQYPRSEIKAGKFMATRYLQLQHSSKVGITSGDGRSLWNGCFQSSTGKIWDISSCGTGVTRLSPGFVELKKPIKSGDPKVSYGSGLADMDEGLIAAILSESLHARGFFTERTLVVLQAPDGRGINIRASENLLRPSHLFLYLKQGNQLQLKAALDYYIKREVMNRKWENSDQANADKYDSLLERIAKRYGEFAAKLEDEYIFCWLDWDGDNMLTAGGIIDYGSIRQFGLCHHLYRYDDVTRFSTKLTEQKSKAKYLVQTFVQLVDFARTGKKKSLKKFSTTNYNKLFELSYEKTKNMVLLQRMGFNARQSQELLEKNKPAVQKFAKCYEFFERETCKRGIRNTPDGINCPAIFDVRNLLRELPKKYLIQEQFLDSKNFLELMRSSFCTKKILKEHSKYKSRVAQFQMAYMGLVHANLKEITKANVRKSMIEITMRASQTNRSAYATGDGIIFVVDELLKYRKKLDQKNFFRVIEHFIAWQCGKPKTSRLSAQAHKLLTKLVEIVEEHQYSI